MNSLTSIIFFGSSHHSLLVLKSLFEHPAYKIIGIVTQPDRPVGRKQILTPTPPSLFAQKHNIPLLRPESDPQKSWFYEKEAEEKLFKEIKKLSPDLLIVAYYGQKISERIVKLAKSGGLNLHPSLLPKYRGSSPGQWAILSGEKETGTTILTVAEKFDQGKIVAQAKVPIQDNDNYETLYARCFEAGARLLLETLPNYIRGEIKLERQPHRSPTPYARKITKEDGKIDWSKPDDFIERQIRAFYPWPGAWTTLEELLKNYLYCNCDRKYNTYKKGLGEKRVKILKSHLDNQGKLVIDELQLEGKNALPWKTFEASYL